MRYRTFIQIFVVLKISSSPLYNFVTELGALLCRTNSLKQNLTKSITKFQNQSAS